MTATTEIRETKVLWDKEANRLYVWDNLTNAWELFIVAADAVSTEDFSAGLALKVAKAGDTMTGSLQAPYIGINTTPDATNKVAVKSSAVLFDNVGAGIQFKVNKAAAGDTASLLFQDAYSGRAEVGLAGDDDFHFKVSPDGSTFYDAIVLNRSGGQATLLTFPKITGLTQGSVLFGGASTAVAQNASKLFWDNTNFRLGVGVASPSYALDVFGDSRLSGNVGLGGTLPVSTSVLTSATNRVDPGTGYSGASFSQTVIITGDNSQTIKGGYFNVGTNGSLFNYNGTYIGGDFASQGGAGLGKTANLMIGGNFLGYSTTDGNVTSLLAGQFKLQVLKATATVATAALFQGSLAFNVGTITNTYGIYLGTLTAGTQTNLPYAFYSTDANASLALAGSARIGSVGKPTTSSVLDLNTTTGALLVPRMTTTQKNALTASAGMVVYDSTLGGFQKYEGGAWVPFSQGLAINATDIGTTTKAKGEFTQAGVNTASDATNKLAVKSAASLFDNVGNGHQIKLNKAAAGDTGSTLYQTGYSGRAEVGLTGDDNFHFKTSPDGSTFYDAITLDKSSGKAWFGSDPGGSDQVRIGGALTINSATMIQTKTSFTNGAGAGAGTLTNAPSAGNPTKWIPVNDNGTTRYIPAW